MVDLNGPKGIVAVNLPEGLIDQLNRIATAKNTTLDDVVLEACLAYAEPPAWNQAFAEWTQAQSST